MKTKTIYTITKKMYNYRDEEIEQVTRKETENEEEARLIFRKLKMLEEEEIKNKNYSITELEKHYIHIENENEEIDREIIAIEEYRTNELD